MNLVDLFRRRDCRLEAGLIASSGEIAEAYHVAEGLKMRGLTMPVGSRIVLKRFQQHDEFHQLLPRDLGWAVARPGSSKSVPILKIRAGQGEGALPQVARAQPGPDADRWHTLRLDWPVELMHQPDADLIVEVASKDGQGDPLFLGVAEAVNLRGPLIAAAKGTGIEIGPGLKPQVLPAKGVSVRYLEKSPIEEWLALYNKSNQFEVTAETRKLFQHYVIGDAQKLECVEDGSLDFIFSSHVIEHLTNPLGTFQAWRRKLRAGGTVIGVVPDANNCFDLLHPLSRPEQWLAEWRGGAWDVQQWQYEKWCRHTQPWNTPDKLRETGYSIHTHQYTPQTFGSLLQLAVDHLDYVRFHVRGARNHKDFAFMLQAPSLAASAAA